MNIFKVIKKLIRKFFFLKIYRKDTPESTWKFYNMMKYFYKTEEREIDISGQASDTTEKLWQIAQEMTGLQA